MLFARAGHQRIIPSAPLLSSVISSAPASSTSSMLAPPFANSVFAIINFSGQGAELLRHEVADHTSDLRYVLQACIEHDMSAALRHLDVSVHAVRAVAGAPVRQLIMKQKLDASEASRSVHSFGAAALSTSYLQGPSGSNNISGLFSAILIRANTQQQCSAIAVSVRASIQNPLIFKSVSKLIEKVCRAKPTRVVGDLKFRTPFESPLFSALVRLDEISPNSSKMPKWITSVFSDTSHIYDASNLEKYIDPEFSSSHNNNINSSNSKRAIKITSPQQQRGLPPPLHVKHHSIAASQQQQQQSYQNQLSASSVAAKRRSITTSGGNEDTWSHVTTKPLAPPPIVSTTPVQNNNYNNPRSSNSRNSNYNSPTVTAVSASENDGVFLPDQFSTTDTRRGNQYYNNNDNNSAIASSYISDQDPIVLSRTRV